MPVTDLHRQVAAVALAAAAVPLSTGPGVPAIIECRS
jgi:hypothetical protein